MKAALRMVKRRFLLFLSIVTILLLSAYILKIWRLILWKDSISRINDKQKVISHDQGLNLRQFGFSNGTYDKSSIKNMGLILFKYLLILNKENNMPSSEVKLNSIKTKFLQKMKFKHDKLVGLIHSIERNERNIIDSERSIKSNHRVGAKAQNVNNTKDFSHNEIPWHDSISLSHRTANCKTYFDTFPSMVTVDSILKQEKAKLIEEPFSLAFSHMLHKDVSIFEIFLALYFRPNNFHCVHVDYKASDEIRKSVEDLVRCYKTKINHGEIFVIPKNQSISVNWGEMSVLDADMRCQSELLISNSIRSKKFQWKYVSSVAGSELPIVEYSTFHNRISTNLKNEMSSVESFSIPELNIWRFDRKKEYEVNIIEDGMEDISYKVPFVIWNPGEKNFSRTLEFKIFKGLKNVILSYRDTEFLINHPFSRQLYDWFIETDFPEEHFLPTLIRISIDPNTLMIHQNQSADFLYQDSGGLTYTTGDTLHGLCPRFTQWMDRYDCINDIGCFGECLNTICNLHTLDLDKISPQTTDCLIANKFNLDVDPMAVTFQFFNVLKQVVDKVDNFDDWFHLFEKISKTKFMDL